jgi:hypothetical protein
MSKPFEEPEIIAKPKIGLKKPENKSMFDNQPKKQEKAQQEEFKQRASEVNERFNSYNERAMEAVSSFMKLLDDQTIAKNKSSFAPQLEQEVIGKFQNLALDMEADELQPNGMGSIGVVTFLLKVALIQRDKINQLDYAISQLQGKVKEVIAKSLDKSPSEK